MAPGAQDLIALVRAAGVPTALVTNTRRSLVEVALQTLGRANFDVLVCGDEVSQPKPHPAHYLAAVAAFGAEAAHCVAIEERPRSASPARTRPAAPCSAIPNEVALDVTDDITVRPALLDVDLELLHRLAGAR